MTVKSQALSGVRWVATAKLAGQAITWGITIVVMRLLSPSDYGLMAMATVFIAFLVLMSEIGLGPAIVQKQHITKEKLRQAFGIVLILNVALCIVLNLSANLIAHFFGDERLVLILQVLSLQFIFIAFTVIPESLLQRRLEFKHRALIDLGSAVASSVLTLVLAVYDFGVWSLVLGNLANSLCRAVWMNVACRFQLMPSFSLSGMRGLLGFGGNVAASRLLWYGFSQADTVILGKLLGKEALGFYSVAVHLASLPVQRVSGVLNQVAFPAFSRIQNDKQVMGLYALKSLRILALFAFPVLWGISSVARNLVAVILGPQWEPAVLPLQLLALVMPLMMLSTFMSSVCNAFGRPDLSLKNVILGCFVMPPAFYIGSLWGIQGFALAWLLAYPVVVVVNMRRMTSVLGFGLSDIGRTITPSALCAAGMYAAVHGTQWFAQPYLSSASLFFIGIATGIASFIVLIFAVDRNALTQAVQLIFKK